MREMGGKFMKRILLNHLPLWVTRAESPWEPLRDSVEDSLELSQLEGKGLGYLVIKSLSVIA